MRTATSTSHRRWRAPLCLAAGLLGAASPALGQDANAPFKVYDTRPVITHGPFLLSPTDSTMTVVWTTDTPSQSRVLYGTGDSLGEVAEPQEFGLAPVGTVHAVHIRGLSPGQSYRYRVESTRVVKLKGYWPDKGLPVQSPVYRFTTLDTRKPTASFSFITDTHEDVGRINALMKMIDWSTTDFLVDGGDVFNTAESEDQLFSRWMDPISNALAHTKPMVYARGNHDMRGPFARSLYEYVPVPEGRFYYTRDDGPVHLIVLDTGEDKPDSTNVYARLNLLKPYRAEELAWLERHVETSERLREAPFRVIVMHQPSWGWVDGQNDRWTQLANRAKVDLAVAGHRHRFSHTPPGTNGNDYDLLVVGQDQVARVDATERELKVVVTAKDGSTVTSYTIPRRER